ncbi:MAG: site-specific integrase [Candidatus Woykebacteria bacterium]
MELPNSSFSVSEIISQYREYLKSHNYSTPTVKNYLSDLRHLFVWLSEHHGEFRFFHINEASLRTYRSYLKEKFRARPSIGARRLSSLRKFLTWAAGKNFITPQLYQSVTPVLEALEREPATPITLVPGSGIAGQAKKEPPPCPGQNTSKNNTPYQTHSTRLVPSLPPAGLGQHFAHRDNDPLCDRRWIFDPLHRSDQTAAG